MTPRIDAYKVRSSCPPTSSIEPICPHRRTQLPISHSYIHTMPSTHFPSKITAIGISKTGDLDVIQELELPFPSPTPTQLVIKVHQSRYGHVSESAS